MAGWKSAGRVRSQKTCIMHGAEAVGSDREGGLEAVAAAAALFWRSVQCRANPSTVLIQA